MGKSRIAAEIDKLEKDADQLRKKAEKKGKHLKGMASDRIDELTERDKRSKKGLVAVLLAVGAAAMFFMKKKRDQELDEALWEEPRSL